MPCEIELWQFIADRIAKNEPAMLLVVAESSGSSPGRAGYKMAVGADGQLHGSIGGGVMEVNLVEQSRALLLEPGATTTGSQDLSVPGAVATGFPTFSDLSVPGAVATGFPTSSDLSVPGAVATGFPTSQIIEQVHRKNSPDASGMICSGRQTVIFRMLTIADDEQVNLAIESLSKRKRKILTITPSSVTVGPPEGGDQNYAFRFERLGGGDFVFVEKLGPKNNLYIIGGGHCALALSELMSRMDFHIHIFDDRPELNTIEKNRFADDITIIENYEKIGDHVPSGDNVYVVVMTLGYASDEVVIRQLIDKNFKYFGVLGSKAKMGVLLKSLREDGHPTDQMRTPIGLPINSRTPEEIAVSIAAEIISVKNTY